MGSLADDVKYWEERYSKNNIGWHIDEIHPILRSNISALTSGQPKKVFVPLCGKTRDIPYLLSLGHQVFGLEYVQQAILDLGTENSLKLEFRAEDSIYHTADGRLQIYQGDLFQCPIEKYGPFDCVWDRGSFIALAYSQRQDYVDVIKRSLRNPDNTYHQFKYLLQAVRYDKEQFAGPPHCVLPEDIEQFYSSWANVEEIGQYLIEEDSPMRKVSGELPPNSYELAYMFTPK